MASKEQKEHLEILLQGTKFWNEWRDANPEVLPDLKNVDLSGENLNNANLANAELSGSYLIRTQLNSATLENASLINATLSSADLSAAVLRNALLAGAILCDANLSYSDLREVSLRDASLSGANLRNAWLSEAYLNNAILNNVSLNNADLEGAYLNEVSLSGANLSGAILRKANLQGSYLNGSTFRGADLSEADLRNSELLESDFTKANLSGANLSNAYVGGTIFVDNDLSKVTGLETVYHREPSSISVDTLYNSGGEIPKVFLLGCGLTDSFITFLPSLMEAEQVIQFHSCFISYSHKDEEFAKHLYKQMRDRYLRVYFAPENMKGGEKLYEQIDHAILTHDRLLIVLSENSMQSEWVITEIRKARKVEIKEGRRKLFPIRLVNFDMIQAWECFDADSGKDLAAEIREFFIPDFSDWNNSISFKSEFDKLLRDLRAAESR